MSIYPKSRNDVYYTNEYTRGMLCPNRWALMEYSSNSKKNRKYPQCSSGMNGKVKMLVKERGMWTTIECPVCGYSEFWAIGDGDELF